MDRSPEPRHDLGGMEEDANIGLEILTRDGLVAARADGHHPPPQLGKGNVQGEGSALLGPH